MPPLPASGVLAKRCWGRMLRLVAPGPSTRRPRVRVLRRMSAACFADTLPLLRGALPSPVATAATPFCRGDGVSNWRAARA
jgi:hypothetical protein